MLISYDTGRGEPVASNRHVIDSDHAQAKSQWDRSLLRSVWRRAAHLAEIRGKGLDLSEEPLDLSIDELAGISQPTLIVSSEDSPEVLRRVNGHLAQALPHAEKVLVTGGHLIDPAHPAVLDFVSRFLTPPGEIDR